MTAKDGKRPSRLTHGNGGTHQGTEGKAEAGSFGGGNAPVLSFPGGERVLDLAAVEALAAQGLSLDQILFELGVEPELPPSLRVRAEAALKKGRALGAARIKKAQYEAALGGSVSAQCHMLELLQDAESEDEVTVTVERVVIGDEGSSEETQA
jgi:hypothetical protein